MKGMKKRRGLKRYYRKLNKLNVCDDWLDALSEDDTWFNLAHEHFDWSGYGNISWKEHREHLNVLFDNFSTIEQRMKGINRPIQLFAVIHVNDSEQDALYFHTPNPYSDYPIDALNEGCTIGVENMNMPVYGFLKELENRGYTVLTSPKDTNSWWMGSYIVYKEGVGESLIGKSD